MFKYILLLPRAVSKLRMLGLVLNGGIYINIYVYWKYIIQNKMLIVSISSSNTCLEVTKFMTTELRRWSLKYKLTLGNVSVPNTNVRLDTYYLTVFQMSLPDQCNLVGWGKTIDNKCTLCRAAIRTFGLIWKGLLFTPTLISSKSCAWSGEPCTVRTKKGLVTNEKSYVRRKVKSRNKHAIF